MREHLFGVVFAAGCSAAANPPAGSAAGTIASPASPSSKEAAASSSQDATRAPSPKQSPAPKPDPQPSESPVVLEPTVKARTDGATMIEWTLEAEGFPAVSKDGRLVALAFGELQTTGPPVLVLTLELRAVDSGARVRSVRFRHRYDGEPAPGELEALRGRLAKWVAGENAALAKHDVSPLTKVGAEREICGGADAGEQQIESEPLEVRLTATRLVVRHAGRVIADKNRVDWILRDKNNPFGNCVYQPVLSRLFVDSEKRVLVFEADYCSTGDHCQEGVAPKFAVHRLPRR
jgi:hypothetical protein